MILLTTSLPPLSLLSVLGVIALLTLSAFFSGMEIAYLTSDRLRVEVDLSKGGVVSKALKMLFRNPDRYVTTVLVGNNIVLVMYGLLMSLTFFVAFCLFLFPSSAYYPLLLGIVEGLSPAYGSAREPNCGTSPPNDN